MKNLLIFAGVVIGLFIAAVVWFLRSQGTRAVEIDYPDPGELTSVDSLVAPYLADKATHALAIGILQNGRRTYHFFGRLSDDDPQAPDSLTLFEIGSITKTFTAAALAALVKGGQVAYDDPVGRYLPEGLADWPDSSDITLLDLATHTSGMPRVPDNLTLKALLQPGNPYARYSEKDLFDFLRDYTPVPRTARKADYSNLGFGLLGQALARADNRTYGELIRSHITGPLGMTETAVDLSEAQRRRRAPGFKATGNPTPYWDLPTLAGAGALWSTTADMLTYVEANLAGRSSFEDTHIPRAPFGDSLQVGLAWIIQPSPYGDFRVVWHNGGTGGFRTFCGFVEGGDAGVVVLSNTAISVDPIGQRLLAMLIKKTLPERD